MAAPHQPSLPFLDTQRLFSHEGSRFQMFSSQAYGQKDLLFKDATSELVPIATQSYEAWLGREYLQAMKGLLCDPNRKSAGLLPHWLQPSLSTGMAVLSGEVVGRGPSPQELCLLASMRTHCFHLPASAGLGRNFSRVAWPAVSWMPHLLQEVGPRPSGSVLGRVSLPFHIEVIKSHHSLSTTPLFLLPTPQPKPQFRHCLLAGPLQ